ncbi:MAG: P-loop NTPase, partial [Selenomonas sp.]|nr:P-loop NTPase [Selenomonas sp.]
MGDQAARLRQLVDKNEYEVQKTDASYSPTLSALGPRVIAVTSGKGGVGKTNISVNLAIALGED